MEWSPRNVTKTQKREVDQKYLRLVDPDAEVGVGSRRSEVERAYLSIHSSDPTQQETQQYVNDVIISIRVIPHRGETHTHNNSVRTEGEKK